ncbi:efflux RND transporter periplasmic adaptor subunit [Thalassovita taeanensis]|uniref:HlyD family secretion protein n=1 Tax=Thalassovita taeanensis TaxID=657014 RepID=A0A1H9G7D1_9RHOB|nr:efflux RND transporter periplasmic adaptor subunit [Thalassovita taeanensis]SEQ45940.1 HlyD family secretion protein [Thalassovita taeanensis]
MPAPKTDINQIVAQGGTGRNVRKWALWAVVAVLCLGGGWWWFSAQTAGALNTYETVKVARRPIIVTVTATGTVEPTNLVEISSELSGTIRSVYVDYNSSVTQGEILAELDTDKLNAQLEHSRATLLAREARVAEAAATLTEKQEEYERAQELDRRGVSTTQSFTAARAALARAQSAQASAEADVRVAAADLKVDEANLGKACICSPINGVVLERNVDVGQIVASSLQAPILFSIAEDLTRMELRVDIDEADIGKVEVGDKAEFTVEAYQGRTFPAVISELRFSPQTIDGVVTYKAILAIDNADLLLRPGMTATADITVSEIPDALTVSNAALRFAPPVEVEQESGGSGLIGMLFTRPTNTPAPRTDTDSNLRTIWVQNDDALAAVEIKTGETDGMITEILDGPLAAGDSVVVDMVTQ